MIWISSVDEAILQQKKDGMCYNYPFEFFKQVKLYAQH